VTTLYAYSTSGYYEAQFYSYPFPVLTFDTVYVPHSSQKCCKFPIELMLIQQRHYSVIPTGGITHRVHLSIQQHQTNENREEMAVGLVDETPCKMPINSSLALKPGMPSLSMYMPAPLGKPEGALPIT
jgi:hypothetical protein